MTDPTEYSETLTRREIFFLIAMGLVVFASRLPWIFVDYGDRSDSYRVVAAARHIAQTGEYTCSRPPGYPIHEYLVASVANAGPVAANGITVIFSCIAFTFFALILRRFQVRAYLLLAMAFAFTPIIYLDSTGTIDTVIALALVLAATYFVLFQRPIVAGMCLGLAIGCRLTSGAMLVPLSLLIVFNKQSLAPRKQIVKLAVVTSVVGGLCFLPVIQRYGIAFFHFSDGFPRILLVINRGTQLVWGIPGAAGLFGLCCAIPLFLKHIKVVFAQAHAKMAFVLCASTILIYLVAFLRLPQQAAYLAIIVPFLLLLVGVFVPSNYAKTFAVLLLASPFAFHVTPRDCTVAGPIFRNHTDRVAGVNSARNIVKAMGRYPACVVVAASWQPRINELICQTQHGDRKCVYGIASDRECEEYRNRGWQMFYTANADVDNLRDFKVDLKKHGARPLDIPDEK